MELRLRRMKTPLLGQTLAGKYRIDARLSSGGMGTVYRGTHVLMDKTVAIKVLRPSLGGGRKDRRRVFPEKHVPPPESHIQMRSVLLTLVRTKMGLSFLLWSTSTGRLSSKSFATKVLCRFARTVEIMRQVGDALHAAHSQNVVHRDLKSDNIMLLSTAIGDYAKVLDFGIAKINEPEGEFDNSLTAPNLVIGTPQYMSPEQCSQDKAIDARSDIYSFGVIPV